MSEALPPGYDHMHHVEVEGRDWPEKFALRMPVADGPPRTPATLTPCFDCGQLCWRSLRVTDDMATICYDCAAEVGITP